MSELARPNSFSLAPRNFDEAMRFADMIADSKFCPKEFVGRPGDVLCAIQFAVEVGLSPMQGLQNIAVINGKPSLYGDAALAVVKSHPSFISIVERDASEAATKGGECRIVVRNGDGTHTEVVRAFSIADATKAGLVGKSGPWSQYPGRMYQMRARAWAMRDALPEALKGIMIREEVEDYNVKPSMPTATIRPPAAIVESAPATDAEFVATDAAPASPVDDFVLKFSAARTGDDIKRIGAEIAEVGLSKHPQLITAYKAAVARIKEGVTA